MNTIYESLVNSMASGMQTALDKLDAQGFDPIASRISLIAATTELLGMLITAFVTPDEQESWVERVHSCLTDAIAPPPEQKPLYLN